MFAAAEEDAGDGSSKLHVRIKQRGGRKITTFIEGCPDNLDIKAICKVSYFSNVIRLIVPGI